MIWPDVYKVAAVSALKLRLVQLPLARPFALRASPVLSRCSARLAPHIRGKVQWARHEGAVNVQFACSGRANVCSAINAFESGFGLRGREPIV